METSSKMWGFLFIYLFFFCLSLKTLLKDVKELFQGNFDGFAFLAWGCATCLPFTFFISYVRIVSNVSVYYFKFKIVYRDVYITGLAGGHSFLFSLAALPSWCFPRPPPPEFSLWKGEGHPLTVHGQALPTAIGRAACECTWSGSVHHQPPGWALVRFRKFPARFQTFGYFK